MDKKRKLFSPIDIVIILIVIICAVVAFLSQINKPDADLSCVIRQNGEVLYTVSLDDISEEKSYTVSSDFPVEIVVGSDYVYVKSSSCPDKICEHTGKISKGGASIVCLPAKVSVTLESLENKIDAVVG